MSRYVISCHVMSCHHIILNYMTLVSHYTTSYRAIRHYTDISTVTSLIWCHIMSCHVSVCRSADREPYTADCPVQHYWHEQGSVHQVISAEAHWRSEVINAELCVFIRRMFYTILSTSFSFSLPTSSSSSSSSSSTLHYTTVHQTTLHQTTLHCTTLHDTTLHVILLYSTTLYFYHVD